MGQVVWGIQGIKRNNNRDPFLEDFGEPIYDDSFDLASVDMQLTIDAACTWAETTGKEQQDVTVRAPSEAPHRPPLQIYV